MKVITIKQPWATLIAEGYKEYEFRTWRTKYRGPILIQVGKSVDRKAMKRFKHLNLEYPLGCIINVTIMKLIFDIERGKIDENLNIQWLSKEKW